MNHYTRFILLSLILLAGCAGNPKQEELQTFPRKTAQELYEDASQAIRAGNYRSAIEKLEALDTRYPFGPYSQKAQLELIFAYYKNGDSASAIATADRFIRQNPRHPNVDYAYYMKGVVNFSDEVGFVRDVFSAPLSERDAGTARQAFEDFAELIRLFPNSQYAKDAQKRMIFLRNRLADYELHVARYYMKREAYVAAAKRAQYVVEHFPKTPAVPQALAMMVTAYDYLGMKDLSEDARRVLKFNYPEHQLVD